MEYLARAVYATAADCQQRAASGKGCAGARTVELRALVLVVSARRKDHLRTAGMGLSHFTPCHGIYMCGCRPVSMQPAGAYPALRRSERWLGCGQKRKRWQRHQQQQAALRRPTPHA